MTRTCTKCGREKPMTTDYYYRDARYRGGFKYECRACWSRRAAEKREQMTPEERAERRRIQRLKARAARKDPEKRQRMNEATARARRKRRNNARKLKQEREARRLRHRLRAEQEGRRVEEVRQQIGQIKNSLDDRKDAFPRLPAGPLARAIDECDARRQNEFFAGFTVNWQRSRTVATYTSEIDSLGIAEKTDSAERMVYGWRNGERLDANFDTVDAVLTRGRWLWWEVYNPDTVRKHVLMVTVRRRIEKRSRPQAHHPVAGQVTVDGQRVWRIRHSMYATTARRFLGDLGTDWEKLWEVEHAFTCEGVDHCWACWHRQQEENVRERERRQGEQLELAEAA